MAVKVDMSAKAANELLLSGHGKPLERYVALCMVMSPERIDILKRLEYEAFLDTEYWRIVRNYVLWEASYRCASCELGFWLSAPRMTAHHLTYERHGLEHLYWWKDLEPLCHDCHARTHGFERLGITKVGGVVLNQVVTEINEAFQRASKERA